MSYQTWLHLSQIAIAVGLAISAIGSYGVWIFGEKNQKG